MIVHRCSCGCVDFFHNRRGQCTSLTCPCRAPKLAPEPEVIPTFRWDGRRSVVVEEIAEPGVKIGSTSHPIIPCSCDRCHQVYGDRST